MKKTEELLGIDGSVCVKIKRPDSNLLMHTLLANGFAGEYGIDILQQFYGQVLFSRSSDAVFSSFIGIHGGKKLRLQSGLRLSFAKVFSRPSMSAGQTTLFELAEWQRFRDLEERLRSKIDVIGIVGRFHPDHDTAKSIYGPPLNYWLGVSERNWLAIDPNYWLMNSFESFRDLLHWQNMIEIICHEGKQ